MILNECEVNRPLRAIFELFKGKLLVILSLFQGVTSRTEIELLLVIVLQYFESYLWFFEVYLQRKRLSGHCRRTNYHWKPEKAVRGVL